MVIGAGWVVAAVLAVLVGVVGIRLVGADLTTRAGDAVSEAQVERDLAGLGPSPVVSASPTASASPSAAASSRSERSFPTRGGTVVANCEKIISMAPAQGFAVHEQRGREGEFRNVRDNHVRVKIQLVCSGGVPAVVARGDDD
ncbi:hypothetical protein GCM10010168_47350 [Actinoplanes ianthinogenes]|nr:hypothetical protein GCM10010168_47350 [Actinoplanes ianthinogenes]